MPKETQETIKKQILTAKQNIVVLQKKIVFLTAKAKSIALEPLVPEKKKKSKKPKKAKAAGWSIPSPSTADLAAAYDIAQNTGVIQKLQDSFLQPPPPPPPQRYSIW